MYAYVKFQDDKKFKTVKTSNIKHFNPDDELPSKKLYKVMWEDGQYYDAVVLQTAGMFSIFHSFQLVLIFLVHSYLYRTNVGVVFTTLYYLQKAYELTCNDNYY